MTVNNATPGSGISPLVGLGLRHIHVSDVLTNQPNIGWFEIHAENYMMDHGPRKEQILTIRQDYPLSLHGVSLSLGSADGLDSAHLVGLKTLIDQFDPWLVSDHLSWGRYGHTYLPDLFPLPYTSESLTIFCQNVLQAQEFLKRSLLIENPSSYLCFPESRIHEADFLKELVHRTGCQILLDVNNIYVSSSNHGWDPYSYIEKFYGDDIGEIHLAGHSVSSKIPEILIDTHNTFVQEEVWQLFRYTLRHLGPKPTLIEWDANLPTFDELHKEAIKASLIIEEETDHVPYTQATST